MERLISLFREADYEQWSPSQPQAPPAEQDEPLYFQQLLAYLREQKQQQALAAESARRHLIAHD
jgi:hypothetical protein